MDQRKFMRTYVIGFVGLVLVGVLELVLYG
jgi:hypothetical protein